MDRVMGLPFTRRQLTIGFLAILVVVLLVLPQLLSQYWVMVMTMTAIAAALGYGFRFIMIAGRFTMGHAAFAGIGGYTAALFTTKVLENFWLGLLMGGIVAGLVALVIGAVVLRVPGLMFAIITMAVSEIFRYLVIMWRSLTGGITGVLNIPSPSIAGLDFGIDQVPYFYLIFGILVVSVLVMYRMERSRIGLTFHAMRQNDPLAQHLGVNIWRYRILCFAVACFFAGLVGGFQAHYWHYVSPATYTVMDSFTVFIYAYVGGLMYPAGPIVGAALMVGLSEGLRMAKEIAPLFYGGALILIIFFLPGGILSLPQESRTLLRQARARWRSMRDRFARAPGS